MNRAYRGFAILAVVAASLRCAAGASCARVVLPSRVEAAPGKLTLADLLAPDACAQLRQAAQQVSLGSVPQAGSVRVLDGQQLRALIESMAARANLSVIQTAALQIPARITVRRAGATKSCAELAGFLTGAALQEKIAATPPDWKQEIDCAGAPRIPEETELELVRTGWNAVLQRWEFALRCVQSEDCLPFLLWVRVPRALAAQMAESSSGSARGLPALETKGTERVVKSGQSATLIWDQAGIRVVLPVTCLDAGSLGEFVRVRLKSAPRILRAKVSGEGMLRASL
jgi:Chaperone for flagella basal body P-ring formation